MSWDSPPPRKEDLGKGTAHHSIPVSAAAKRQRLSSQAAAWRRQVAMSMSCIGIESQYHIGWKRSLSPTLNPVLPRSLLNHDPKCHIHTIFECSQGEGGRGFISM